MPVAGAPLVERLKKIQPETDCHRARACARACLPAETDFFSRPQLERHPLYHSLPLLHASAAKTRYRRHRRCVPRRPDRPLVG